ncbi:MAG: hypothetical protein BIFFINMI_01646 [Phycisphaerae bacterium]|nr:hypothetical protein [Phycisphaerae bacterium]
MEPADEIPAPPRPADWWFDRISTVAADRLVVNGRCLQTLRARGLDSLEAVMASQAGRSLTKPTLPGHRERLRLSFDRSAGAPPLTFYLKRYRPRPMRRLRRWLAPGHLPSEAADEWSALWQLASAGVPVPEPVLMGNSSRGSAASSCIGLVELDGAQSLEKWLPAEGPHLPMTRRRALARALGRFVGYFHSLGLVHRDLYLAHLFMSPGDASSPQPLSAEGRGEEAAVFHLIDLARVFRPRWRTRRWRVKDLGQLLYSTGRYAPFVTRTDALRFFRCYLRAGRLDGSARRLARSVVAKSARIARHAR